MTFLNEFVIAIKRWYDAEWTVPSDAARDDAKVEKSCAACGKERGARKKVELRRCGGCKSVCYCSVECQKGHWASHKKTCKTATAVFALLRAIQANDAATIRRIAKTTKEVVNGKVDYSPNDMKVPRKLSRWTPLHECVRVGNNEAMQLLIDGGLVDVNMKDGNDEPPFLMAAANPKSELLVTLLKAGANPNTVSSCGISALMIAVRQSKYENAKALLEAGASVNVGRDSNGRGALEMIHCLHGPIHDDLRMHQLLHTHPSKRAALS